MSRVGIRSFGCYTLPLVSCPPPGDHIEVPVNLPRGGKIRDMYSMRGSYTLAVEYTTPPGSNAPDLDGRMFLIITPGASMPEYEGEPVFITSFRDPTNTEILFLFEVPCPA